MPWLAFCLICRDEYKRGRNVGEFIFKGETASDAVERLHHHLEKKHGYASRRRISYDHGAKLEVSQSDWDDFRGDTLSQGELYNHFNGFVR
jgi:hypothetical protein